MKLQRQTLRHLPDKINTPKYKQEDLKPAIVHFGVGNFHRSHQAMYLNELFNQGLNLDWALIGSGMHPQSVLIQEQLQAQDYLYSLVEQSDNKNTVKIIASMTDYICGINDKNHLINTLCDKEIKIVSLTITEGGYFIDSSTGLFDDKHKDIIHDAQNPEAPVTVFGIIINALEKRKAQGLEPFTIMSCDNIPHNGHATRNTTVGLAKLYDKKLAQWIAEYVAFPNSMVDRITPVTTQNELDLMTHQYGIDDSIPVFSEDFTQWVLEDNFPTGRPNLEKVGVTFVHDVSPYEEMKIKILNGGHAIIAYAGGLMDIEYVDEAMANTLIMEFLKKVVESEVIPVVPDVPNTNLHDYFLSVIQRFSNTKIKDTIRRLCLDGSNRQPKFIIPTIADCIKKGIDFKGLAIESALWCRYCYGTTQSGAIIEANDPMWHDLQIKAKEAKNHPLSWLEMTHIYGEVGLNSKFQEYFTHYLNGIWMRGVANILTEYGAVGFE